MSTNQYSLPTVEMSRNADPPRQLNFEAETGRRSHIAKYVPALLERRLACVRLPRVSYDG